ncbi:hypothetical protein NPIL_616791 [Nephila pilipes]|uniref:Uncharacterized protein n=1 Tax=Nephila pilipes TaxID=299642 RepID=A0A8X6P5Y7_NEPPI|nr:hypothetical protein NPIL_616791 [Nephila pilipes]
MMRRVSDFKEGKPHVSAQIKSNHLRPDDLLLKLLGNDETCREGATKYRSQPVAPPKTPFEPANSFSLKYTKYHLSTSVAPY